MAMYECEVTGNFSELLTRIHDGILSGSMSASYEDGKDLMIGGTRIAVRVYERYSMIGSNRVSLSVTLVGNGDKLSLVAITSGGSQAVLFKLNTFGENAFLDKIIDIVSRYTG